MARPRLAALGVTVIGLIGAYAFARFLDDIYEIRLWLVWRLVALWFWVLLWNLGCVSFGAFLLARLRLRDLPALEAAVFSMATGVVGFAIAMFAGGALGWYKPVFAIALSVAMTASGARDLVPIAKRLWAEWREPEQPSLLAKAIAAAGTICVGIVYLGVLSPDALNYDATWSHVVIAQEYARAGRMIPFLADYNRNVPHLASLIYTWGYLVPGKREALSWMFALQSEFSLWVWTLAAVAAGLRAILAEPLLRRGWVCFFLFPAIFVYDNNLGGASDHVCGFFSIPIALATLRVCERFQPGWAVVFALACAGAVLTKLQALFLVLPACLVLAFFWLWQMGLQLRARRTGTDVMAAASMRDLLWAPAIVTVVGIGAFAPHLLRQFIFYKNPFYPFMQDVFVHSTPTVPNAAYLVNRALADPLYQPQGTLFEKMLHSAELFVTFSFVPHYSFSRDMPIFGSLFTLLFPCLIFLRNARLWTFGAIAGGAVFVWGMVYNVDRNLQAFMPVLVCVTGAIVIMSWQMGWWARIGLVPVVTLQLVWGSDALFFSQQERLNQAMDLIKSGYEGNAHKRFADFRGWHLRATRALPVDARVVLHTELTSLGLKREVLLDNTGFQGLFHYDHLETPRQMYQYFKTFGVTHMIDLPDGAAAPTSQEEVLWDILIARYATKVEDIGALRISKMPDAPPPEAAPLRVVSIGQEGYQDGIYPITKLSTIRFLPEWERRYAEPDEKLNEDKRRWHEVIAKADAVIVQKGSHVVNPAKALLKDQFTIVRDLRGEFTVYAKKAPLPPSAAPDDDADSPP